MNTRESTAPRRLLAAAALLVVLLAAVVTGCGGGVGVGGTGATAFAAGPITGFGSIFVNGVEFDDASARVEDEDGVASARGALRLGMLVEVESGAIGGSTSAPTATATRIRYASAIVGAVASVDATAGTLVVLGQTVATTATTVFDASLSGGLASIAVDAVVEVFGFYDVAAGRVIATRIEPRDGTPLFYRLRGPVRAFDAAAHTFSIGDLALDYTAVTPPAGLANGSVVRLRIATTPVAGRWQVLAFGDGLRSLPDLDEVRLRGPVTALTSTRSFSVNGQAVDASGATFPDGEAGVVLGARVEVEGPSVGGVLRARKVEIDDDGGAQGGFELRGNVEQHRPLLQTFVLRGITVFYGAVVEFDGGTAANIADGVAIEARGVLSADGTALLARRIRFRN